MSNPKLLLFGTAMEDIKAGDYVAFDPRTGKVNRAAPEEVERQSEFTIDLNDGDPPGPPYPDCHCGRWVSDDRRCSGCQKHPLDCSCSQKDHRWGDGLLDGEVEKP